MSAPDAAGQAVYVELSKSGRRFLWDDRSESLLEFIEDQGVQPDFSCRSGICGTCVHRLVSGEVDYFAEPLNDPGQNEVFLCCSRPRTSVIIEL
jgi:ferredoxin